MRIHSYPRKIFLLRCDRLSAHSTLFLNYARLPRILTPTRDLLAIEALVTAIRARSKALARTTIACKAFASTANATTPALLVVLGLLLEAMDRAAEVAHILAGLGQCSDLRIFGHVTEHFLVDRLD